MIAKIQVLTAFGPENIPSTLTDPVLLASLLCR